jgi:hypothetical protein
MFISACEDDAELLYTPSDIYYPLAKMFSFTTGVPVTTVVTNAIVNKSQDVTIEMNLNCDDPIKEIKLYRIRLSSTTAPIVLANDTILVSTTPFVSKFSSFKKCDTLLINYNVEPGLTTGNRIFLRTEVVNENTLTKTLSTITFRVGN